MRALLACLLLFPTAALAQAPDAGEPPSELELELDAAAKAPVPAPTAAAPAPNPVVRAIQSLNPDLAAIVDITGGFASAPSYSLSGDDPDLKGGPVEFPAGFTVQELEVALTASVDPYFRGDVFLTIPNLEGIEVEEAFVTTTGLPWGLQAKAGIFRSAFGRQNAQHLHVQSFTKRPLLNEAYLGGDGLRAPGVQLSWLFPTPFFLQLTGEAFSVAPPEDLAHLASFGGGERIDLTYALELEAFAAVTDALSVSGGLNAAFGRTPGLEPNFLTGGATLLQGADLYVKYKPANVAGGFFSLAWQTELMFREVTQNGLRVADGGVYSQLVVQVDRRWFLGLRQDVLGILPSGVEPRVSRTALSVTFEASEFARLRFYLERETQPQSGEFFLGGPQVIGGYLQLEASIGAHGAHSF